MRIAEEVRKGVVFVGILDLNGAFVPYGTAFIAACSEGGLRFAYLVTARHVLEDIRHSERPMVTRINLKSGESELGTIDLAHWYSHPDDSKCDISVAPITVSSDTFDVTATDLDNGVLSEDYISKNDIGCGDEVFTVGLLTNHFGTTQNIPIVRTGNIAAMPDEPIHLNNEFGSPKAYLIESRSIGGLSGSPVYLNTPPFRIVGTQTIHTIGHMSHYIIGVNVGLFWTKAHGDTLPPDESDRRATFLETMSAGIAVVLPIQRVLEIINCAAIKEGRRITVERYSKDAGFAPTSAIPKINVESELPTTEENPLHREAFNSLVNAATKTPRRDD